MAEDINGYFEAVSQRLTRFDRDATVGYCLGLLEDGKVTVAVLYEQILAPALNAITIARQPPQAEAVPAACGKGATAPVWAQGW